MRSRKAQRISSTACPQVAQRQHVIRRLDQDLVGADAVHLVVEPVAQPVEIAFHPQGGELVGDHAQRPARFDSGRPHSAGRPAPRAASCSRGRAERAEVAARRNHVLAHEVGGRMARSVAMITQRPVIGTLRNSGNRGNPPWSETFKPCIISLPGRERALMSETPGRPLAMTFTTSNRIRLHGTSAHRA